MTSPEAAISIGSIPSAPVADESTPAYGCGSRHRVSTSTEDDLVISARTDPDAIAALYERHAPAIHSYLHRRLGDRDLVDDALSETFASMVQQLPRFELRGLPFRSWLYRLAEGSVSRARRARSLAASQPMQDMEWASAESTDEAVIQRERAATARRALLRIAPKYQAALALHYLEGLDLGAIARVLGIRRGTVKSRLARGRVALRRQLEREGYTS